MAGFADHCSEVVANAISQLAGLYKNERKILEISDVHQNVFLDSLGKLFATLITLDDIIYNQSTLKDHWAAYKRILNTVQIDPKKFHVEKEKVNLLKKLLAPTEKQVLEGNIFKLCISQVFERNESKVTYSTSLGDEFGLYLKTAVNDLEISLSTNSRGNLDREQRFKLIGVCGLYVLYNNLCFTVDKKLFNKVVELCKKVSTICLHGNIMWFPEQFLLEHLPALAQTVDKKIWQSFSANRQNFLQTKSLSALQDSKQFHNQLNSWMMQMESSLTRQVNNLTLDHLQGVANLLLQGLKIADTIRYNVSTILNLHGKLSKVKKLRTLKLFVTYPQ